MARRTRNIRRSSIVLRDIVPPSTLATDLFRGSYLPVITAWTDALPRIEAAYTRTLSEITQDSPADVRAEIDGAAAAIDRLVLLLSPGLRDWALRVEQWQRGKWRGAVLSATGVDLQTMIGAGDMRAPIETAIEWNTSLIRDVSDQARQRISNAVFDGLRNRTPAREVAKSVREAADMGRARSVRIASDQLSKITSSLADERRREAGIDAWRWRHSGKLHPRADHVARNGKEYTDETAPKDRPGQLPFCGCRGQAVITFD
jgi:uncharacterized protein with gpF-like domain